MKQLIALCLFAFPALLQAQESKAIKRKLSYSLNEKYYTLPADKKVKHGVYEVVDENNKLIVKGNYNNGAKDGIWEYYNDNGVLVQKYDYTNGQLVHYAEDTSSFVRSSYTLLQTPGKEDEIDIPYKIGGDFFELNLLYNQKNIPQEIMRDKMNVVMTYILSISETGKLTDWEVAYKGQYFDKTFKESIKNLPLDAYEFSPAKLNDKPVKSKIIYTTNLNYDVLHVPRTNNIITQKN
jgi:antitoxin component YwqK of YwqJK toxin-antitoxin module